MDNNHSSKIKKSVCTGLAALVFGLNGLTGCATTPRLPNESAVKIMKSGSLPNKIEKDHDYYVYRAEVGQGKNAYLLDRTNDEFVFRRNEECWKKLDYHNLTGEYVANFLNKGGGEVILTEILCYTNPEGYQDNFNGAAILPNGYEIPKKDLGRRGNEVFIPCPEKKPFRELGGDGDGGDGNGGGPGGGAGPGGPGGGPSGGSGSGGAGG